MTWYKACVYLGLIMETLLRRKASTAIGLSVGHAQGAFFGYTEQVIPVGMGRLSFSYRESTVKASD